MYLLIKDRRQAMKGFAKGFTGSVRMLASASFLLIEMAFVRSVVVTLYNFLMRFTSIKTTCSRW